MNVQFKKGVLELCVLLRRLTKEEYFTTYLQESSEGPSRKYYTLTDKGRTYLYQLLREWNEFSQGVNQLIKEGVSNDEK